MSTIKHSGEPIEPVLLTTPPFFFPFLIFTEPISLLIQPATLKVVPTSLFSSGDILTRKVLLTFFVRKADFHNRRLSASSGASRRESRKVLVCRGASTPSLINEILFLHNRRIFILQTTATQRKKKTRFPSSVPSHFLPKRPPTCRAETRPDRYEHRYCQLVAAPDSFTLDTRQSSAVCSLIVLYVYYRRDSARYAM